MYQAIKELLDNAVDAVSNKPPGSSTSKNINILLQYVGEMYTFEDASQDDVNLQLYTLTIEDTGCGIPSLSTSLEAQSLFTEIFASSKADKTTDAGATTGTFGVGVKSLLAYNAQFDTPLRNSMNITSSVASSSYCENITVEFVEYEDVDQYGVVSSSKGPIVTASSKYPKEQGMGLFSGTLISIPILSQKGVFASQHDRIIELIEEVSLLHHPISVSFVGLWEDHSMSLHGVTEEDAEERLMQLSVDSFIVEDIEQEYGEHIMEAFEGGECVEEVISSDYERTSRDESDEFYPNHFVATQ